eukprot:TRINITY_DN25423_c0_g1_i1.p1 TRINITY_DN25423_c0_g1~~TRINITY_DN25423_c0_g1_i1.p1  ORF type:complete len:115 (-),score=10.89 TRINITY_DN25423_c0_g1_i1:51-362(-)
MEQQVAHAPNLMMRRIQVQETYSKLELLIEADVQYLQESCFEVSSTCQRALAEGLADTFKLRREIVFLVWIWYVVCFEEGRKHPFELMLTSILSIYHSRTSAF